MNILFAASEGVPLAKSGGLADVIGSLPQALCSLGSDVRIIMPAYGSIPAEYRNQAKTIKVIHVQVGWRNQYCGIQELKAGGIHYYLIDNEYYFKRHSSLYGYGDEAERFMFFCLAVMEAIGHLDFSVDILHAHDWQTGLLPFLLKTKYAYRSGYTQIQSVFTIHNLMYQGLFSPALFKDMLSIGDNDFGRYGLEFYGAGSCMKAGLQYADKLTTVSPSYAAEIQTEYYGEKLEGVLRSRSSDLSGILNGIDTFSYNPITDEHIKLSYYYSLEKKNGNKEALQRELGLTVSKDIPLIGIVSRMVKQKGFDLIAAVLDEILAENIQMVILGSGDENIEQLCNHTAWRYPGKFAVYLGFNEPLSRRIYAGSDLFLMPSLFEPCGLSQLIALRYRTIPIVRETGGLRDTVQAFNEYTGKGNGFSFSNFNAHDMLYTIRRALRFYRDKSSWEQIVLNTTKADYSWRHSAAGYMQLYSELIDKQNI
jgi:starch synthase